MKTPKRLLPLLEDGLIDEVLYRLMSGKEADIFVVRCGNRRRCAKVYKEVTKRNFKKASNYTEGRKIRNGRRARAMEKRSAYGRQQQEELWQNAEVDALNKLIRAGVRVPETFGCVDGVLLMELVCDDDGEVAPRLDEVILSEEQALEDHAELIEAIKLMLCAGIVHGDLSEFNVLLDSYGPVIIDLPQAVDAAANNNAKEMLFRDVENISRYYAQFAPQLQHSRYAEEIWAHYESGDLQTDTVLTGVFEQKLESADVDAVLEDIKAVLQEEQARIESLKMEDDS